MRSFSWTDDNLLSRSDGMPDGIEPEPEDVPPEREQKEKTDVTTIDSEDEDDEDDAPPAPFEAPPGFSIATSPPTAEQLELKVASSVDALVGRHSLFKWPVVGWCVGRIMHRNHDARSFKLFEGERVKVNFIIFYEIDQQSVKTALHMEDYNVAARIRHGCCSSRPRRARA